MNASNPDGWRVWITRDEPHDGPLARALVAAGRVPVLEPVLHVVTLAASETIEEPLAALTQQDWLVLTSARAVQSLPDVPIRARVGVVGPATRRAAVARGLTVSLTSRDGTGAGLWKELDRRVGRVRILFPRSEEAEVPQLAGVEILAPAMYGVRPRDFDPSVVDRVDAAAFASPSAVRAAARVLRTVHLPCLSIGPTTTGALVTLGVRDIRRASEPTFVALARTS